MFLARGLRVGGPYASIRDGGTTTMRQPSKPLFKTYEIVAIVAFVIAAIGVGSLRLVY